MYLQVEPQDVRLTYACYESKPETQMLLIIIFKIFLTLTPAVFPFTIKPYSLLLPEQF